MPRISFALLATGILCYGGASAQSSALVTDRPDFTESTASVQPGAIQVETGVTFESGDARAISGPELLARIGIARRIELRIGAPDYTSIDTGPSGLSDMAVGAKLEAGGRDSRWKTASILTLTLPTGEGPFSDEIVVPDIIQTISFEPGSSVSFGAQVQIGLPEDENGDRTLSYAATIVAGRELAPKVGSFLEVALAVPAHGDPLSLLLHHGYTWRIKARLQVDIHGGLGLTDEAPAYLIGAGVSLRFPE